MGTMERLVKLKEYVDRNEIPCDFEGDTHVINELLKRISNLEFEVEKYENILDTLEKHLLDNYKENMDSVSEKLWTIANQSMYIYNYIQELKGSDKEWEV